MRVTVTKEESTRKVLEGGVYGQGLDHEADVELVTFEWPAETNPGFDKDGKQGPWALFVARVVDAEGNQHFPKKYVAGPGLARTLTAIGVAFESRAEGGFDFDDEDVAGRKIRGIEVKAPREYNDTMYTGDISAFIAND